jgi:hypothetical protein
MKLTDLDPCWLIRDGRHIGFTSSQPDRQAGQTRIGGRAASQ